MLYVILPQVYESLVTLLDKVPTYLTGLKTAVNGLASRFELLSRNPQAFMWVSPVSQELSDRYSLVHRPCVDSRRRYKDVLIYRQDYTLSALDKQFIAQLIATKRELPDNWDR